MTKVRSFHDFSQLKSLKCDLEPEKHSEPLSGTGSRQERKKPVLKTADELRETQRERETGLRIGMRVALLDARDRGYLRHIRKDHVEIELDSGITVPCTFGSFVPVDKSEELKLRKQKTPAASHEEDSRPVISHQKLLTVDLHLQALPDSRHIVPGQELPYQLECFRKVLRERLKHKGSQIVFIHGVGDGVLKDAIRQELDQTFALSCRWNPRGPGETVVTIR